MTISRVQTAALATAAALLFGSRAHAQSGSMGGQPMGGQPTSQQSNQQQQQPNVNQTSMVDNQDSAASSGVSGQTMKDKIFLRKAAQGGLAEVQLGQLASQKGNTREVKDFGAKMVTDHTELNDQMKPIADSLGVMLPKKLNSADQAELAKLNGLSGNDFDNEYLAYMVKDHHTDLREFRMEAATTSDPTLKTAVDKGAKVIHEHMRMVDDLARARGIPVPSHGPHAAAPPA